MQYKFYKSSISKKKKNKLVARSAKKEKQKGIIKNLLISDI